MCFVFIWEQTATCATYSINWLNFITEMKSVYFAVRTGSLNKAVCASYLNGWTIRTNSKTIRCSTVCTVHGYWLICQTRQSCGRAFLVFMLILPSACTEHATCLILAKTADHVYSNYVILWPAVPPLDVQMSCRTPSVNVLPILWETAPRIDCHWTVPVIWSTCGHWNG